MVFDSPNRSSLYNRVSKPPTFQVLLPHPYRHEGDFCGPFQDKEGSKTIEEPNTGVLRLEVYHTKDTRTDTGLKEKNILAVSLT